MAGGRPLRHPEISQVRIAEFLRGHADPIRLGIVYELMKAETGQSCVETIARVGKVLASQPARSTIRSSAKPA